MPQFRRPSRRVTHVSHMIKITIIIIIQVRGGLTEPPSGFLVTGDLSIPLLFCLCFRISEAL